MSAETGLSPKGPPPAAKIEAAMVEAVGRRIGADAPTDDAELISASVDRIEVRRTEIEITLLNQDYTSNDDKTAPVLTVPWSSRRIERHP